MEKLSDYIKDIDKKGISNSKTMNPEYILQTVNDLMRNLNENKVLEIIELFVEPFRSACLDEFNNLK